MRIARLLFPAALLALALPLAGQGLAPQALLHPDASTWPMYNGDYSGRRYSSLELINPSNVDAMTLAWAFQSHASAIKATPLLVQGVLYLSAPDNVWAVDARTGRTIWHFHRPSQGDHLASRGVAVWQDRLYFGTPDAHLICLDARTGKTLWDKTVADVNFGYYLSVAPVVIKDKVIVGTSGDSADVPHFLIAFKARSGEEVWRWSSLPQPGTPAFDTWPNAGAIQHGGGPMWMPGTYDPELNLLYWGTGNPHPVLAGGVRRGANLYTCSIVALDPDTGKLVWSFQASPHDTHDWDAVETPVLFDATIDGKPRKLLAQASRNGYYFVLDRSNGRSIATTQFVPSDWASGIDANGQPIPDPAMAPQPNGSLTRSNAGGSTNWMAPSYDPQTGMFYVNAREGSSLWYLTLDAEGKPQGHQGGAVNNFWSDSRLVALDATTGKIAWTRPGGPGTAGNPGILTTAGHLLFTGDAAGNLLALDPATGKVLWHSYGGAALSNSPMTYALNHHQYVLMAAGSVLYAWTH